MLGGRDQPRTEGRRLPLQHHVQVPDVCLPRVQGQQVVGMVQPVGLLVLPDGVVNEQQQAVQEVDGVRNLHRCLLPAESIFTGKTFSAFIKNVYVQMNSVNEPEEHARARTCSHTLAKKSDTEKNNSELSHQKKQFWLKKNVPRKLPVNKKKQNAPNESKCLSQRREKTKQENKPKTEAVGLIPTQMLLI